jgi:hypothetical protein
MENADTQLDLALRRLESEQDDVEVCARFSSAF